MMEQERRILRMRGPRPSSAQSPLQEIPFVDLGRAVATERGELDAAIARVLDSGRFVLGDEVAGFERELAAALGVPRDVAGVASGTDAIELALRALGAGPGDEVVTQANTCVPTVAAIMRAGATPVLCDADPDTAMLDPDSLEAAVGPRTKAIVPVHLYGQVGPVDEVRAIAEAAGAFVVEDCAQALGAGYGGRPAGSFGDAAAFSFYPTKNLGALGDGGAVVAGAEIAERARALRVYGADGSGGHPLAGVNSRLDELQAAILRARLPRLAERAERRRAFARRYLEALEGGAVTPLSFLPDREHAWHLFVVRAPEREAFRAALRDRGVATLVHYDRAIHQLEAYAEFGNGPVPLAGAETLAREVVSLPLYPELSDAEVDHVASSAAEAAR